MSASFLDSKVLRYLFNERSHRKFGVAEKFADKARRARNTVISTEDLQHGQIIEKLKIIIPFLMDS